MDTLGVTHGIACDISTADGCDELIRAARALADPVNVLINNAGVIQQDPEDLSVVDFEDLLSANAWSGFRLAQAFLPSMLDRNDHGRIVWVSSLAARSPDPDLTAYAISKGAQLYLTSWCAQRARGTTITSTAVLPGLTVTDGAEHFLRGRYGPDQPDLWQRGVADHPRTLRNQPAAADEIASMVAYLTTPAAGVMQGRALVMDGGELSTIVC